MKITKQVLISDVERKCIKDEEFGSARSYRTSVILQELFADFVLKVTGCREATEIRHGLEEARKLYKDPIIAKLLFCLVQIKESVYGFADGTKASYYTCSMDIPDSLLE